MTLNRPLLLQALTDFTKIWLFAVRCYIVDAVCENPILFELHSSLLCPGHSVDKNAIAITDCAEIETKYQNKNV